MSMQLSSTVNVHEAKAHLSRLLARVEGGEEFVIARVDTHTLLWRWTDQPSLSALAHFPVTTLW